MTGNRAGDTGLPDALSAAPRPGGDPSAVLALAATWAGASGALRSGAADVARAALDAAAAWQGQAALAGAWACARAWRQLLDAADGLEVASAAMARFAAVLAGAQQDWDGARRVVDLDVERQLHERSVVLATARASAQEHSRALALSHRLGGPLPDPPEPPHWSPDVDSPERRRATQDAFEARERVEAAARQAAATLEEAGLRAWPLGGAPRGNTHGWALWQRFSRGPAGAWSLAVHHAPLTPPLCLADAGYTGGGFATGPDGRSYPMVVPYVVTDTGRWTGDQEAGQHRVEDLDGRDPGWRTLWTADGVDLVGGPAGFWLRIAAALAGSAGWAPPASPRADAIPFLQRRLTGYPVLTQSPPGSAAGPPASPLEPHVATRGGRGVAGASDIADVVSMGLQSAVAVQSVQDARKRWYVAQFEENADGRTRVLVRSYWVFERADGTFVVRASWVHVDEDGEVVEEEIAFRPPEGDTIRDPSVDYVVNPPPASR